MFLGIMILIILFLIVAGIPVGAALFGRDYKSERKWSVSCGSCKSTFEVGMKDLYPKDSYCGGYFIGYEESLYAKCPKCSLENVVFRLVSVNEK